MGTTTIKAKTSNSYCTSFDIKVTSSDSGSFTYDPSTKTLNITATFPNSVTIGADIPATSSLSGVSSYINQSYYGYAVATDSSDGDAYPYNGKYWTEAGEKIEINKTYAYVYTFLFREPGYITDNNIKVIINGKEFTPINASSQDLYIFINLCTVDASGNLSGGDFEPAAAPVTTPTDTPTEETTPVVSETITSSVTGDSTLNVTTQISEGTAKVADIPEASIEEIIKEQNSETISINVAGAVERVKSVELSKETFENLAAVVSDETNSIDSVTIQMKNAEVIIDEDTLNAVLAQATGNDIKLVVETNLQNSQLTEKQQEVLADKEVERTFEAYFMSNGQRIGNFNGGSAIVSLGFTLPAGKDAKHYHIYYLQDDGTMTRYATRFNNGRIEFTANHFSDYCIIYDETLDNATEEAIAPTPDVYVVQKGDCFWTIARKLDMKLSDLLALNADIAAQKYIYAGQVLNIIK